MVKSVFENSIDQILAVYSDEILTTDGFLQKTWDELGANGFLGANIDANYGGESGNHSNVIQIGKKLVTNGFGVGMALSWITHLGTQYFLINQFASDEIKNNVLSETISGKKTVAIAYTEPNYSGKPKDLVTCLKTESNQWTIDGEKTYVTNGLIADYFVVFVRDDLYGPYGVTAFLIKKDIKGLKISKKIDVKSLAPSPHCQITFEQVKVDENQIIGERGQAYQQMLKPMRDCEDAYLFGALLGGYNQQMAIIHKYLAKLPDHEKQNYYEVLGVLHTHYMTMNVLLKKISDRLDKKLEITLLNTAFKMESKAYRKALEDLLAIQDLYMGADFNKLDESLSSLADIGGNMIYAKLKNIGKTWLTKE